VEDDGVRSAGPGGPEGLEEPDGASQRGRLIHVEDRLLHHEQALQRMKGMMGAFGGLLTAVHLAIDYFLGKH
jgi:hypothetical protein